MKNMAKLLKSSVTLSILIAISSTILIILIRNYGKLQFMELAAYDYYLKLKIDESVTRSPITLITIEEPDIQRFKQWPIPDAGLAQVLNVLLKFKPRVIGLDIYRDYPVPPGSEELIRIFSENPHLVTIKKMGDENSSGVSEPYMVKNKELIGFNDVPVDPGGIIRRALLFMDDGNEVSSSFALLLASFYLKIEGIYPEPDPLNPQYLKLGKTTFIPFKSNDGGYVDADSGGYQFILDFQKETFKVIGLSDVLHEKFDPELVHNRIVMIGARAESLKDIFFTPLKNPGSPGNNFLYGLELHAQITSQLIRAAFKGEGPVASISECYEWLWIGVWGLLGAVLGLWIRSFYPFALMGGGGLAVLFAATYLPFQLGWWLPVVPPAMAWIMTLALVAAYLSHKEKTERSILMHLFSRHVSKDVADALWKERESLMHEGRLKPQKLTTTVLFTDIEGFTPIAEKLDPHELMDWLNEYLDVMARLVMENGGMVNKYIGDALMAVFGAPATRMGHDAITLNAKSAARCALAMERELAGLNEKWKDENKAVINMRIGIHTGPLVAGSLGSAQRMEYTVLGDTVNIASRLESYRGEKEEEPFKGRCCRILISESTFNLLDHEFETRKVGDVSIKGKGERITVYRVLAQNGQKQI